MKPYLLTWLALVVLATISLFAGATPAVGLGIAAVKALLVAGIFMHLSHAPSHRLVFATAIAFLLLLVLGVMADVATRDVASAYVR